MTQAQASAASGVRTGETTRSLLDQAVERTQKGIVETFASRYRIPPAQVIDILRATVIKPAKGKDGSLRHATLQEIAAFLIVANEYGLNPFTKQIYAFVDGRGSVIPVVSIDGWISIVNRQPNYQGVEWAEELDKDGNLEAIVTTIYVRDRKPLVVREWLSEIQRPTELWRTMRHRMARHKGFIQGGRYAFGLGGIYDADEAHDILMRAAQEAPPERSKIEALAATVRQRLKAKEAVEIVEPPQAEPPATPPEDEPTFDEPPQEGAPTQEEVARAASTLHSLQEELSAKQKAQAETEQAEPPTPPPADEPGWLEHAAIILSERHGISLDAAGLLLEQYAGAFLHASLAMLAPDDQQRVLDAAKAGKIAPSQRKGRKGA